MTTTSNETTTSTWEFLLEPSQPGLGCAFFKIHQQKLTGRLSLEWERFKKQILFKNGEPMAVKTNSPYENFGAFLVKIGRLEGVALREEVIERDRVEPKSTLGAWLLKRGKVEAAEIPQLLEQHFADQLFNLLSLTRGKLVFQAVPEQDLMDAQTAHARLRDPFFKAFWDAIKREYNDNLCRARLSAIQDRPCHVHAAFPLLLAPQELRLWNQLCEQKPIRTADLSGVSLQLFCTALELDLVVKGASESNSKKAELEKLLVSYKNAKPHSILSVSPQATVAEVQKAFHSLIKLYHPDRLPPDPELRKLGEQVFACINQAFSILNDVDKRREIEAQAELEKAGGREKIEERLKAEMMIPEIKNNLKRRQYAQALEMLKEVSRSLGEDAEILADRAYAEMMLVVEQKGDLKIRSRELVKLLERSIVLQPKQPMPHYYLGMLYKFEGQSLQALESFDAALELDPHFTEAQSEARVIRMRKDKPPTQGGVLGGLFGGKKK